MFSFTFLLLFLVGLACRKEQRANIKFCQKNGCSVKDTLGSLRAAFGQEALSLTQVRFWWKRFAQGATDIEDRPRPGRPNVRQNKIQQISTALDEDRSKSIRQLSEEVAMVQTSVHRVLHIDLDYSKLSCKFVPHVLTDEQRRHRVKLCQDNLELVRTVPKFLDKIITRDECWVSIFENHTKLESCQWLPKGSDRPTKALRARSTKKTMLTVFFDICGVILIDFAPQGVTIDADYYCSVLKKLKNRIRKKRPGMWRGGVDGQTDHDFVLHHDNAPSHTAARTLALIGESGIDLLAHPQYSPDLAPADFFLFSILKQKLCRRKFATIPEVQDEVCRIFKAIDEEDFTSAIRELGIRWKKCIKAEGSFFEVRHVEVDPVSEAEYEETDSETDPSSADNVTSSDTE